MGSNQFQREYIEYLQERNSELLKKLTHMKENYENKIFSKDLNKHYLMTALEDVLNVCTVLPKEIDSFFEKITGAMDVLKNILIKKSEMVQLTEKITLAMNPMGNHRESFLGIDGPALLEKPNFNMQIEKKVGTAKISPMINGCVISTEPRICLNRISEDVIPGRSGPELSPIIEVSPNTSLDASGFEWTPKDLRIPLERINFNKPPYNCINMGSPKSRFKGPKTWKESLMANKQQADTQKNETCVKELENLNRKQKSVCNDKPKENEEDPLEGPSWLYNKTNHCNEPLQNTELHAFVDCRPRKYRFAGVFDRSEKSSQSIEEKKHVLENTDMSNLSGSRSRKAKSEKINETPEDLIRQTLVEDEENDSPVKKKLDSTYRKYIEEISDENGFSEFETDTKKKASTPYSKITDECSPVKPEFFYEADCEENPSERKSVNKSYRKRRSRSIFNETLVEASSEIQTSPDFFGGSDYVAEEKPSLPEKRKAKNSEPKSVKEENSAKEVGDCRPSKKIQGKRSSTMNPAERKKGSTRGRGESSSPETVNPENQSRKRRKAAPKNLREPLLNSKLRRE